MRTNEQIKATVEGAFRPFRCVAEIWDYDYRLRFKVFDENDRGLIELPDVVLRNLRDETQLRNILAMARERLLEKGYRLDPWELK